MSDQDDWDFAGADDAKSEIRAAVRHLLNGVSASARGDMVRDVIEIVRQVANGPPSSQPYPFDNDALGG